MSVDVQEKYRGRTRSTGKFQYAEIAYLLFGSSVADDDVAAEEAVLDAAPTEWRGMRREGIGLLEEIHVTDTEPHPVWEATVRYSNDTLDVERRDPGFSQTSFRTTGGTTHLLYSRKTIAAYGRSGESLYDFHQAVNVAGSGADKSIEGYDRPESVFEWQETWVFADSDMTVEYITTLYNATDTINKAIFRIFGINDCLFLGAEGNQRADGNWEVTFHFAAAKSIELARVGQVIGPIKKRGWDYLWVYFREEVVPMVEADTGGTTVGDFESPVPATELVLLRVPFQVNIEQIFDESDFTKLKIGAAAA